MISIIIPVFNQAQYLRQAIESALSQQRPKSPTNNADEYWHEVIVVDDGSTDNSAEIARSYGDKIKFIQQSNNGLPFARNAGINATFSKYGHDLVLCLDSDDWISPDYLKKTVPLMTDGVGVVGTWAQCFGVKDYIWHTSSPSIEQLMKDNCVPVCSLIKRGALQDTKNYYNIQLNSGYEDWNLWLDILKRGYKIEILPEPLFHYREKESSMLKDATKRRPELLAKIHSLHPDLWPPEGSTMLDKWANRRDATSGNEEGLYGIRQTYLKAAEYLTGPVEDWGCGKKYSQQFFHGPYKGIDGTPDGCDQVADLTKYTSDVEGIMLRHVLEHNFEWKKILVNALKSCKKLCVIVCTPFEQETKLIRIDEFGIPIFSFSKVELTSLFPKYRQETVYGDAWGQKCEETIFYVEAK